MSSFDPAGFNPQKIALADYPHPVGTILRRSMGSPLTVVDRNGYAYLACCIEHEKRGNAFGYHPQADRGQILDRSEPARITSYRCPRSN
ncbi:hypothetical protein ACFVYT_24780 [Streptomyces sp. NPDC058290]|uniref:hypothetical protein n=1 Tax=Streptomyces sp. NPDC058290 TaxID=3346426 RepID=UPI0036E0E96B